MESIDREKRLMKEKDRQREPKTEKMDETERKWDNGNNRQGELTKNEEERQWKPETEIMD